MIRRLSEDEVRRHSPRPLVEAHARVREQDSVEAHARVREQNMAHGAVQEEAPERRIPSRAAPAELTRALVAFLDEELALAPERIRGLVDRELARFHGAHEVTVCAHPDDLALLAPAELGARHGLAAPVTLQGDASLRRGGCLIRAASGEVDARVETRIERVLAALAAGGS